MRQLLKILLLLLSMPLLGQEVYNEALAKELEAMLEKDSKHRREVIALIDELGNDDPKVRAKWDEINEIDSLHTIRVNEILDEHGWLGVDVVGSKGNVALFLIIQHAKLDVQVRRLPMIRQAVKDGKARSENLALLEDRVATKTGKKQIYGSQLWNDKETGELYVLPMIEPEKVNERRASVGLGTIEEYIAYWNLKWDVEAHKKRVAAWEASKEN
ncbi:DUF6624 domain-containing protein [Roseivirga sp. E12]|uniref:DUF6624 domain-containing protein n=1 Tax=Roseivirga sp. E12 TaxID=2819237 RepID=UPI001ABCA51D|nr:DUF6624 domain-containing protein [Roseivirga sp. E12]MBO3700266.1 hypothetical protein [Roseivirga sp. E12]